MVLSSERVVDAISSTGETGGGRRDLTATRHLSQHPVANPQCFLHTDKWLMRLYLQIGVRDVSLLSGARGGVRT
jgi:hypothetical protein